MFTNLATLIGKLDIESVIILTLSTIVLVLSIFIMRIDIKSSKKKKEGKTRYAFIINDGTGKQRRVEVAYRAKTDSALTGRIFTSYNKALQESISNLKPAEKWRMAEKRRTVEENDVTMHQLLERERQLNEMVHEVEILRKRYEDTKAALK